MNTHAPRYFAPLLIALATSQMAHAAPETATFTDRDDGSDGPLQDAHQGEIVFAHAPIERATRDATLVSSTTVDRPLYARVYFPKTPARLIHESGRPCSGARKLVIAVKNADGKDIVTLFEMKMESTFAELRSKAITDLAGNNIVPIIPSRVVLAADNDPATTVGLILAAALRPGTHPVDVEARIRCGGEPDPDGTNYLVAATGRLTFEVTAADLRKLARQITLARGDAASTPRMKRSYTKLLAPRARLLGFAADGTVVFDDRKETRIRALVANADKTCSFVHGTMVEDFYGNGKYSSPDLVGWVATPIPCP